MQFHINWHIKLGEGGEGSVYRGVLNGRACAVKVPHGHEHGRLSPALRPILAQGLKRELARVQQARGDRLIEYLGHNFEITNTVPYIVYELASGGSLERELERFRNARQLMPLSLVLARLDDVLVAVSQLHASGLIHRDIKPANLLGMDDGRFKLADFGLGRSLDRPCDAQTVGFAGTPAYAAPEQLAQQCFSVSADLFAVGGVAWALLTNNPPPRDRPLPPMRVLRADAIALEPLVTRLLAIEPNDRPESADVALQELRTLRAWLGRSASTTTCVRCGRYCSRPPCRTCHRIHH